MSSPTDLLMIMVGLQDTSVVTIATQHCHSCCLNGMPAQYKTVYSYHSVWARNLDGMFSRGESEKEREIVWEGNRGRFSMHQTRTRKVR